VLTAAMLSYRKDKYGGKTELEVLTVLYSRFDIGGKIPMLYDNIVHSAIVFSDNTANLLEF
jgi:hypothetical protein